MRERQGPMQGHEIGPLPPQVLNLPRCERELAIIVYLEGGMTAKLLEARLPRKLSNSALRAMLQRLCCKGILCRHKVNGSHVSTDRRIPYLYTPGITPEIVRARALQQIARDYFDGSLLQVVEEAVRALQESGSGIMIQVNAGRSNGPGGLNIAA
ncbi:MAG TPA: BlaI/MecI/CopY family transcriptional regulator [Sphingomicrobium sp.]|nr:BlaI/MecI/CopY family transcriptional regulator [Sphingomicrobium sp.]